jgi:DNA-binding NarL/FixJ family response regulator
VKPATVPRRCVGPPGSRPDVILMDLRMPELDGVGAIRELVKQGSPCRVLVLTTYDSDTDVLAAIEAGATGFLLKDAPRSELLRGVEAAARGEAVLAPVVASKVIAQMRAPAEETLSDRELEVLTLVSQGASNQDVAGRLFISEATVKTHLRHIYDKLGANDRASAVAAGYNLGLLTPERR